MTRSLAARIFLAIVLTNVLVTVGVSLVLASRWERRREAHARVMLDVLRAEGLPAAEAFERGDEETARRTLEEIATSTGTRPMIVAGDRVLATETDHVEAARAAVLAARSAEHGWAREDDVVGWIPEGSSIALAIAPPGPPSGLFELSPPSLAFLLVLVLAAAVSYLLARGLSAPIRAVRAAAARVSAGDLSVRVTPSLSKHADAEVAALARDFDGVTTQVELLLQSRERLLRDVSHELRSPLARLSMALEVARETTPPEGKEALDRIERESERLEELVSLVLTMARLDNPGAVEREEGVRLDEIVADVRGDAEYEARTTNRRVESSELPEIVLTANAELLRQAIENVVRNALRFAPEGSAIELSLTKRDGEAVFTVRDHGPGVPPDKLADIFRPFTRLSAARERNTGGAGLGLAITERAVRIHGGHAEATNAEGGGLRVELVLPL